MNRIQAKKIFDELYPDRSGYYISLNDRKKLGKSKPSFTYGEIDFMSFATIFSLANVKAGEIFYDLGCGVGKPVIAGALLKPFGKCIGVELLPGLYKRACEIKQRFDKEFKPTIEGHRADISFINKDLLDVDISSGDVFYLAATCFNDNLIEAITKKTKDVKVGSRFMMLSKQIHDRSLFLQWASVKKMGWGDEILYIYKKIH
ncbi:hypothetical protein A2690_01170 [Candidatus Roizmanbacteria bacterium RIFCSPHIGHO2_01_FULL_39_12b]|uniref:Histone-lysine N-methyltransferase, H3 lysine-79 specific n=1 Tax=Candidatus Roizmanbacteria bacterium RIFCSPHIGHO2_01_FULL_39_12b TaxID=1802030 RepID=A0A1F7GBY9_9BACT|nr:MAG: hypothetical protein A2690_01170 [Candidatus Roizmanbacteria bacterium RIFCSPHIGHO2_01_FULL_39_12b]